MNSNLKVWAIQNNRQDLLVALQDIKKDSNSNILYLNCVCRLKIADTIVKNRRFDACFCSEDSDVVIFFAKGMISNSEIEETLKEQNINYNTIVFAKDMENFEDDAGEIDVSFIRDKDSLNDLIDDSLKKKQDMCLFYPGEKSSLFLGYKTTEDRFVKIDGRICKGIVVFKDKLALLVSQGDSRNLTNKEAKSILENKGVIVLERGTSRRK